MEFSDDVLGIIRAFSKPIGTRTDWRTCKQNESTAIRKHATFTQNECRYHLMETETICNEIADEWTLYGRRRMLRNLLEWFIVPPGPLMDWYETRVRNYDWQTDEIMTQAHYA